MRDAGQQHLQTFHPGAKRCREIIDKAAELGIRALSLTGGEPLFSHKEAATIIKHAARRNIVYTRTATGGKALDGNLHNPGNEAS